MSFPLLPKSEKNQVLFLVFAFVLAANLMPALSLAQAVNQAGKYYLDNTGNDAADGSIDHPWETLSRVEGISLHAGDEICLRGGQVFHGTLSFSALVAGSASLPIRVRSYGSGRATIDAGSQTAITCHHNRHLYVSDLILQGKGRKTGNQGRGLWMDGCTNMRAEQLEIHGFQHSGLEITDCAFVDLKYVDSHDNGYAGISVTGSSFPARTNHDIYIGHCRTANNPGDPTEMQNHSGNGIVAGLGNRITIEYSVSTGNGWDMPRQGNGPVGIWAWEADSVLIQYCIAYRNHTSAGSADGGGFDLDGGVTHSVVQFNLAYENEGYGYGVFQFSGATPWHHNTFRYNVSFDDGNTTQNGASILWWNGSRDSSQFHDAYIYHNLFYNSKGHALGVVPGEYDNMNFFFLNNIIVAKEEFMGGGISRSEHFYGNDWWSNQAKFKFNGIANFMQWINQTGQEKWQGKVVGSNVDPRLASLVSPSLTDPDKLKQLRGVQLSAASPLRNKGLDLLLLFHVNAGPVDFFGNPRPLGKACEPGIAELK